MKLTILGTGNAMVTKCYNTCFAIEKDGHYFLVDGGGGNTIMKQQYRLGSVYPGGAYSSIWCNANARVIAFDNKWQFGEMGG